MLLPSGSLIMMVLTCGLDVRLPTSMPSFSSRRPSSSRFEMAMVQEVLPARSGARYTCSHPPPGDFHSATSDMSVESGGLPKNFSYHWMELSKSRTATLARTFLMVMVNLPLKVKGGSRGCPREFCYMGQRSLYPAS